MIPLLHHAASNTNHCPSLASFDNASSTRYLSVASPLKSLIYPNTAYFILPTAPPVYLWQHPFLEDREETAQSLLFILSYGRNRYCRAPSPALLKLKLMLMLMLCSLGVIASVICVAGAGFRLSLILNAVGCEIASAGLEIHSISKGVTLFSLMLKQVGQALQASDSVHSAEALETAQEIKDECQLVFNEIEEMLEKVKTKKADGSLAPSIQQRFRWCFKKGRVQYLLGQLESLKMSLVVLLQILQLGRMMALTPKRYDSLVESRFGKSPIEPS
jgi:hypothetical protein